MHALPALLCSAEALMPLGGFHAPHGRQGMCQRGAANRQGERTPGPISPETLAHHLVTLNRRDLERVCNGASRALAKAGVCATKVTGMADGTDGETTARERGGGQVTRKVRIEDTPGRGHAIEVTVSGWHVRRLLAALTKIPLGGNVGKSQAPETHGPRALVTPARAHLAGPARRHKVVCDRGLLDGTELGWLDQQGLGCVGPAQTTMAVTAEARAQAAAGEEVMGGRRALTGRHGQGQTARPERLETEGVGITGLTTDDQSGTPAHARQANRRAFHPTPIHAVVVRRWHGPDEGPGGTTVFLTHAPVAKPLPGFADDDDRRLIETCGIKAYKQPGEVGHPPQKTARAVQVHVVFTRLMFALATAYRLPCAREAVAGEPIGWPRWRRRRLEPSRDKVIVFAQGSYGIFPLAEYSLRLGVKRKDVPPGIDTRQEILAKYQLTMRR